MSITEELRKWADDNMVRGEVLTTLPAQHPVHGTVESLLRIADRIDAEHEKAMSMAAQLLADAEKDRDTNYSYWQDCKQKVVQHSITMDELSAEIECLEDELSHCIGLPKDADGEYIHIGDVMDSKVDYLFDGRPFEVRALVLCEDGWEAADGRFGNRYELNSLRHHKQPTVEDVPRLPHWWTHDGTLHVELPKLPESISVRLPDQRDREVGSARTWQYTLGAGTCKEVYLLMATDIGDGREEIVGVYATEEAATAAINEENQFGYALHHVRKQEVDE